MWYFFLQDGTPIDLEPTLTFDGVVFSYLDTSTSEIEVLEYISIIMIFSLSIPV